MSKTFQEKLRQYAAVIVNVGLNLQAGQRLIIGPLSSTRRGAPIESAPLCRLIAEEAYKAGAREVEVLWHDPLLDRVAFHHGPAELFEKAPAWRYDVSKNFMENQDAIVSVYAPTPGIFDDVPAERMNTALKAQRELARPLMGHVATNQLNWCVVTYPAEAWVDKVLADVPAGERMAAAWDLIFDICRVSEGDPVANWQAHVRSLTARSAYLNGREYDALVYKGPGTDLTLGLPEGHRWQAAQSLAANGVTFTANIPTEEVFTLPHKDRTSGTVTATKPLVYAENLIDEFALTFEDGRVVKATAKTGEQHLNNMLDSDEGARRLGEVALVPNSSPISQSGRLFFNTLYDENASSHIALGRAYQFTLSGGNEMDMDAFQAAGGNDSIIHVDFMIGSGELDIDGVRRDGSTEPVMRNGEYAFDV
jgi:aminopeptidase